MTARRCLLGLLMVLALSASVMAQQAQDLYQRGLVQEHAAGRLEEAISLYTQAARATGADRALAARALMRAAGCWEKLGRLTDAARVYADVIRTYPDQRVEAARAQERSGVLNRRLPTTASRPPDAEPSDVSSATAPMFARYCASCHNAASRAGGLDLGALDDRNVGANAGAWENVLRRLRARRDPPAGAPRPPDDTYRTVIERLDQALDAAYASKRTANGSERADDLELAARLAGLIWNGAPDGALLDDARRGRLRVPTVLNGHVVRLLRDPRSAALVDTFFTDWLGLDRIRAARPDPSLYRQVDATLLRAMDTETRLFLASQLRDDRDAVELWTANYTYVDERLARHYGLPGVTGDAFRRVEWPDSTRAGILGQAGPLTALSFAARTSPTVRGQFVLARFFGVEAPSPPANVPPLAERPAKPATMRDRLREHQVAPSCAGCHVMFDPLGHALEHFDPVGRWRTTDGGLSIDAAGAFIDGTRFDGPAELRSGLLTYRDAYYTGLTQRLLAFALNRTGRAGRVYDYEMPAVRAIVRDAAANGNRWSAILTGVAASAPFQMKQIVP